MTMLEQWELDSQRAQKLIYKLLNLLIWKI